MLCALTHEVGLQITKREMQTVLLASGHVTLPQVLNSPVLSYHFSYILENTDVDA